MPEASEPRLRYLRQIIAHAVSRSFTGGGAPVHLNAPFRDPLAPVPDDGAAARVAAAIDWKQFFGHLAGSELPVVSSSLAALPRAARGIIIVGASQPPDDDAFAGAVGRIASHLGWPVLADGLSPIRNHAGRVPPVVSTYDLVLRNPAVAKRLIPDVVLCIGGWPISKVLRAWLETSSAEVWLVTDRRDNRDALHGRTRHLMMSPAALNGVALPEQPASASAYAESWAQCERAARATLDTRFVAEAALFEPKAAWLLARHLPAATPVVIANSMPIRDVEYTWPPGDRGIRMLCNRGANGIDGTLSTALGIAHGSGRPAVLLTGDLALLHDSNGMLVRPKFRGSLTIVLINNRGGGIFEHLPVAEFEPPFEEFFATPQQIDFASWCRAYGVEHMLVRGWDELVPLLSSLPANGVRVLEVPTDRKKDAAQRKQWFAEIAAAIS